MCCKTNPQILNTLRKIFAIFCSVFLHSCKTKQYHFYIFAGEQERTAAYGLVSATFAASLVTSPALGVYVFRNYGRETVVALATAIAALDVLFGT